MKEIVGLVLFLSISGAAILMAVRHRIGTGLAAVLLLFSIVSGFGIANQDLLRKAFLEPAGLKTKEEVAEYGKNTAEKIRSEAEAARESISFAATAAKSLVERVDARVHELEAIRESARESESRCRAVEDKVKELAEKALQAQIEAEKTQRLAMQLGLIQAKVIWLQTEAAAHSEDERIQAACQQILDGLDELVTAIIPDPKARADFIATVKDSVPAN